MLRIAWHAHAGGGLSVGGYLSYNKHTDDNFDNIRSSASRYATISEYHSRAESADDVGQRSTCHE